MFILLKTGRLLLPPTQFTLDWLVVHNFVPLAISSSDVALEENVPNIAGIFITRKSLYAQLSYKLLHTNDEETYVILDIS